MNVTMDGNGYVHVDNTYHGGNLTAARGLVEGIYNSMSTYDNAKIRNLLQNLNDIYPTCVNFSEFLNEWARLVGLVIL